MSTTNSGLIYKITDKTNGKIYIGQTHDLKNRIRQYRYDAAHCKDPDQKRNYKPLDHIMNEHGFENFEFSVLSDNIPDNVLDSVEVSWIYYLHATDPNIGYNIDIGGAGKPTRAQLIAKYGDAYKPTHLSPAAKLARSIGIATYNPDTGEMQFRASAKILSDELGNTRSEVTKANNRGSRLRGMYIFYIDEERRSDVYMNVCAKKRATGNTQALMSLAAYEDAYSHANGIIKKLVAEGRLTFDTKDIIEHEEKFKSVPVRD